MCLSRSFLAVFSAWRGEEDCRQSAPPCDCHQHAVLRLGYYVGTRTHGYSCRVLHSVGENVDTHAGLLSSHVDTTHFCDNVDNGDTVAAVT